MSIWKRYTVRMNKGFFYDERDLYPWCVFDRVANEKNWLYSSKTEAKEAATKLNAGKTIKAK